MLIKSCLYVNFNNLGQWELEVAWDPYTDYFSYLFLTKINIEQFNVAQGYHFQKCAMLPGFPNIFFPLEMSLLRYLFPK